MTESILGYFKTLSIILNNMYLGHSQSLSAHRKSPTQEHGYEIFVESTTFWHKAYELDLHVCWSDYSNPHSFRFKGKFVPVLSKKAYVA